MKINNIFKYALFFTLMLLVSCSPRVEYTGVGDDILSPITNLFTIEAEKSGVPFDTETQTIRVGENLDLYFRDSIGSTENTDKLMATWSLFNGPGTMLVQEGGLSVRYNATSAGTVEVHAEHDDIKKYVVITILPAISSSTNTPPTISENCQSFFPGENYKCQLSITDSDSSSFVWSEISDSCNYFSLNGSTGEITGTIPNNPLASCSLTIKANDGSDDSNQLVISLDEFLCPTGYVSVPGNNTLGTTGFCVMQFEAKNVAGVATSEAANSPWVNINATDAYTECSNVTEVGFDGNFSLISNPEWMTIARNAENVDENWSGGGVGSGCLFNGNTGNNTTCGYGGYDPDFGGDTRASRDLKARLTLDNQSQVWDMSGNFGEMIDWNLKEKDYQTGPTTCSGSGYIELNSYSCSELQNTDYLPENTSFDSNEGIGLLLRGNSAGVIRGGDGDDSSSAVGIYNLRLDRNPSVGTDQIAFRCVYRPAQPPIAENFSAPNPYENTERIITLDYYDVNYDQATSCSIERLTNVTETTPCSCNGSGVCTVGITGITNYSGPASFEFNVTAGGLKSNNAQATFSINGAIACPTGFVHVIGNSSLGTDDFCVMQFEAKNNSGAPVSRASGSPWVNINATNAFNECASLSESGFGGSFALISNPEWMTIARDIENYDINWSGGSIGAGHIPRGHSDNSPSSTLSVTDILNPYDGTGNNSSEAVGSGWEQRRTHRLSSGQEIWDYAGNVWEWMDWDASAGGYQRGPTSCSTSSFVEITSVSCGALSDSQYNTESGTYTRAQSIGSFYGSSGGAAFFGGGFQNGSNAGVFSLNLRAALFVTDFRLGFRCVYRPN